MSHDTVLVTGASSGIGLELARCFAAEGCRVVLLARSRQTLQSLADELRKKHRIETRVLTADLAQPGAPARVFADLKSAGVTVDVLVNNAGFGACGQFAALPLERQLEMIQVNVTSLTYLTGLFLPGMIKRRSGGVLNVASTAAFQPGPGMAIYYATKAFVLSFSEAIAEELRGTGVIVSALCPGPTTTNFGAVAEFQGSRLAHRASMSAAAVACYGHRAFRRGRVVAIPGIGNRLLAFSVRLSPRAAIRKIVKSMNAVRKSKS